MRPANLTFFFCALALSVIPGCSGGGGSSGGGQTRFTTTDLGVLAGGHESVANALNNLGQAAGYSYGGDQLIHAFLFSGGQMQDIGALPGMTNRFATALNDSRQVAGYGETATSLQAFLWQNGQMSALPHRGGPNAFSVAYAINNDGAVAGAVGSDVEGPLPARWQNGALTVFEVLPNGYYGEALGINSSGDLAGYSGTDQGRVHAMLWRGGQATDLHGALGFDNSVATAINSAGTVAGYAYNENGPRRAVVWQNGVPSVIGSFGSRSAQAWSINSRGDIVGTAETAQQFVTEGFVYRAGTSPGSVSLLGTLLPRPQTGGSSGTGLRPDIAQGDINDGGQIAGATSVEGQFHAAILTPQ